jgi:MFS family permease
MQPDKLVLMANQIGTFFATQRGDDPATGIADHLRKFWDPRMRAAIVAHLKAGGAGLRDDVRRAVALLETSVTTDLSQAAVDTPVLEKKTVEGGTNPMATYDAVRGEADVPVSRPGLLDRERIIAKPGYNRWLVPPAALAIHLCIGMAYGFSVFWLPLQTAVSRATGTAVGTCAGGAATFGDKLAGTAAALTSTTCEWTQFDLGWLYTLFFVLLGISAATWGGWLERVGPRKAGVVATFCWCGGLAIAALGVAYHQLWLMWLGAGFIGGIGLGLGYISPVSTLIKWFPDRRGMATGMAIAGFGGGALIGSPLAAFLINGFSGSLPYVGDFSFAGFKTPTSPGVWETLLVMAGIYFVFMITGSFMYRLPPPNWKPEGWTPPATSNAMIATGHVHLRNAHKTWQFWLIWIVLCMNVSAGIGIIGAASPMLQETFGGRLFGDPNIAFEQFNADNVKRAAAIGAAFVGLFSLFNIIGRFFWASLSDVMGRKTTYFLFFVLGFIAYASAPSLAGVGALAVFAAAFCLIASMYGGGFATVPAYLADMFGTQFVGAIHGRLLTAWSTAGILGPVLVNYLHDTRKAQGVPASNLYEQVFYVMAGLLVIGFLANLLIRPVNRKWFMTEEEVAAIQAQSAAQAARAQGGSYGIGKGSIFRPTALLAWLLVGIPLGWGVWITLQKAAILFQ